MKLTEFLDTCIGKFITEKLDEGHNIHVINKFLDECIKYSLENPMLIEAHHRVMSDYNKLNSN